MASQVTITKVTKEPAPSSRILINFSDGSQLEFGSVDGSANALQQITEMTTQADSDLEFTRKLAIALWKAKDANLSNTALALKTVTFDLSAANPIRVQ